MTTKGRIFTVAQSKGGSGKTTYAIALAIALSERKREVLAIDADWSNTHLTLKLRRRNEYGQKNPDAGMKPIKLATETGQKKMVELAERCQQEGMNVVIDVSPAHEGAFITALSAADVLLLPSRLGYMDQDAHARLEPYLALVKKSREAQGYQAAKVYSVLTDFRPTALGRAFQESMERQTNVRFLGTVAHSERFAKAFYEGMAYWEVYPNAVNALTFKDMIDQVIGR